MCLYAWILDVGRCADLVPVCFGVGCGMLCRSGSCMLRYWLWSVVPIFSYMLCFFVTGQDVHSLLFSAVEFSAGDVAAVWAAAEEV